MCQLIPWLGLVGTFDMVMSTADFRYNPIMVWTFLYLELGTYSTAGAVVMFSVSHRVTQIPTGDIMSWQFCGNHPFLKMSVITPGETAMSHGNRRNFQKWTILPRDTISPAGICVTPWDTVNITTDSTVDVYLLTGISLIPEIKLFRVLQAFF